MSLAAFAIMTVCMMAFWAAYTDIRHLTISNRLCLFMAVLFVPVWVLTPESFAPWWSHVAAGGLMLVLTYGLFCRGWFGGGDAKLVSALSLWLGLQGVVPLVFFTALAGGVLAIVGFYIKKKKPFPQVKSHGWIGQLQAGRDALPYGVAISVGAVAAFFHSAPHAYTLHEFFNLIHS